MSFSRRNTAVLVGIVMFVTGMAVGAQTLSNEHFEVEIGRHGEISSLQLVGDAFPTNYVLNAENSPILDTEDHKWLGELMLRYRVGDGTWRDSYTSYSGDVRQKTVNDTSVSITYRNSTHERGVSDFRLTSAFSLENDYLQWEITVENTAEETLEIGDLGLPLSFNERWPGGGEVLYETRVVCHSHVANNSSYLRVTRPSGIGSFLLMVPDDSTGAGFEYRDVWDSRLHPNSEWAVSDEFPKGLFVYYIHSDRIKSTERGYLPNTSLKLSPGEKKTYAFKFFEVPDKEGMKDRLFQEGLVDVTVVPGMTIPSNLNAKVALRTSKTINSVTAQYPNSTSISHVSTNRDYEIYELEFSKLGHNNIKVDYGEGETTTLQFNVIEQMWDAVQRHATFLVEEQMWDAPGTIKHKVFDDWYMDDRRRRNRFDGYWGWGDDWGYPKAEFLAQKNIYDPVESEIQAVDEHMETVIWNKLMQDHHQDYLIHDFLMPEPNTTPTYRGYAYPHIYNTYFALYQLAKQHSDIYSFIHTPDTYLLRAFNIMKALYSDGVAYNWETGLMGEQTTPEIIQALQSEGFTSEADEIKGIMERKYRNFSNNTYPFGSEYVYDNTGEEAVYTLAKMNDNVDIMRKIDSKTRACRGNSPLWYYYSVPVTICGEGRWNGQYTAALAGYCMNHWMLNHSSDPAKDARMVYAAKIANLGHINSGQISSHPDNIGAAAWTYHSSLGPDNYYYFNTDNGQLQNGWRNMDGEAQLGFWGAIRILSADVAHDPVFGLYGYGCEVSMNGNYYDITPKDGLCKRLNIVDRGFSMELKQDRYKNAMVSRENDYLSFTLENMKGISHETELAVKGLSAGSYYVFIDEEREGPFNVEEDGYTFDLPIGKDSVCDITIQQDPVSVSAASNRLETRDELRINRSGDGFMMNLQTSDERASEAEILIVDPAGRVVKQYKNAGNRPIFWRRGKHASGMYMALAKTGQERMVRRLLLLGD